MLGEQRTAGQVPTNMESRVICIARHHPLYLVTPVLLRHAPIAQASPQHLADSPLCVLATGSGLLLLEYTLCQ